MPRRVAAGRDTSPVASGQRDDNAVMRRRFLLVLATPVLLTAGCALGGSGQAVVNVPGVAGPGVAGAGMPFPECQTAELAFAGESTLAAVGLSDFAGGPEANKVGMIWITAGPVAVDQPMPVGGGKGGVPPSGRWVCVQWPDGSGMAGNIPDGFVLPASLTGGAAPDEAVTGPPIGVLALVIGAVVLVGVSVLAFRREGV